MREHILVAIDYGQIEARVIAMASKDKRFVKALWDRYDVHTDWAKRIARIYPRRISGREFLKDPKAMKNFRTDIKNQWTFPLFFGAQLSSVATYLKIPEDVLERPFADFQQEFSGIFEWQKTLIKFYNENGYVENLFKRRRRAPISKNELINTPIQSTACEIVMDGMNRLSEYADKTEDWYYQPIIQIHDELIFKLPVDELDKYLEKIITEMLRMDFPWINVPITLEVSIGPNLLNMEEIMTCSSDDWQMTA